MMKRFMTALTLSAMMATVGFAADMSSTPSSQGMPMGTQQMGSQMGSQMGAQSKMSEMSMPMGETSPETNKTDMSQMDMSQSGMMQADKSCKDQQKMSKDMMGRKMGKMDIVDTAMSNGQFNTLTKALEAAGLTETLKGKGPYTVFAPTDSAFAALPKGTLEELLKPENRQKLQQVLTYHVVPGKVTSKQVMGMKEAKTVEGAAIRVSQDQGGVMVNNANVVKTDIKTSNGMIHVIDRVLIPES